MKVLQLIAVLLIVFCLKGNNALNKASMFSEEMNKNYEQYQNQLNNQFGLNSQVKKTENLSKEATVSNLAVNNKNQVCESMDGCCIVLSYFQLPKKPKRRPYHTRWPKPVPLPKPITKPPYHATCGNAEGALFLIRLRETFPKEKPKKKNKKKKAAKVTKSKNGQSSVTKSVTIKSTVKITATGVLSGAAKKIIDIAKAFVKKYKHDNKIAEKPKSKSKSKSKNAKAQLKKKAIPKVKAKKLKKRHLTDEQRRKLNEAKVRSDILKRNRKHCYQKISNQLESKWKNPYKGKKCHHIGRLLRKCFSYM